MLENKQAQLEKKKNRLKEQEALLKLHMRKMRTRKLIEWGALIEKADITHFSKDALLGALISVKHQENDQKVVAAWTQKGASAFQESVVMSDKTPLVISFTSEPHSDTLQHLKSIGLKWNRLRKEWEGFANINAVKGMIETNGGMVRVLEG